MLKPQIASRQRLGRPAVEEGICEFHDRRRVAKSPSVCSELTSVQTQLCPHIAPNRFHRAHKTIRESKYGFVAQDYGELLQVDLLCYKIDKSSVERETQCIKPLQL